MALIDDVKLSLGFKNDKKDSEIQDVILTANAELKIGGAEADLESFDGGALYKSAVKMYARSWFNYQGQGERWFKAFEHLRDSIAMSGLYKRGREDAAK